MSAVDVTPTVLSYIRFRGRIYRRRRRPVFILLLQFRRFFFFSEFTRPKILPEPEIHDKYTPVSAVYRSCRTRGLRKQEKRNKRPLRARARGVLTRRVFRKKQKNAS